MSGAALVLYSGFFCFSYWIKQADFLHFCLKDKSSPTAIHMHPGLQHSVRTGRTHSREINAKGKDPMCGMLKATQLTSPLVWVCNCAYIVHLSNCPPHLMQVFCAGGRQQVEGGGAMTRVARQKAPQRYLQELKDSIPSSQQSVLAWCWIHVKT